MMWHQAVTPVQDEKLMQNADLNDETRVSPYNEDCLSVVCRADGRGNRTKLLPLVSFIYLFSNTKLYILPIPTTPNQTEINPP